MRIIYPKEIYEAEDILEPYIVYDAEFEEFVLKEDAPQEIQELYKKTCERRDEITREAMRDVGRDFDEMQRARRERTARRRELAETMKREEYAGLTAEERLTVELEILQEQYEQAFGTRLCYCGLNRTVSNSFQEFGAFLKELLLDALQQGRPYPEERSEEAREWEKDLLERLKRRRRMAAQFNGAK